MNASDDFIIQEDENMDQSQIKMLLKWKERKKIKKITR